MTYPLGPHGAIRYLGRSATAGDAMACEDCGARWYPDMGERPPAACHPTPDTLRRRAHPTHLEHAATASVATPCTAAHVNFGGGCLNCGWAPIA